MLNNEERNLLVKIYKEMPDAAKLAKVCNVSVSSVYRLVRQMKDTGFVDLRTGSRGRKPSLTSEDIENIRQTVIEQPDITYLKETLIPTLHPWDIVIMDNPRTHHIEEVRTLLSRAGVTLTDSSGLQSGFESD